jgi:hypothetical protein
MSRRSKKLPPMTIAYTRLIFIIMIETDDCGGQAGKKVGLEKEGEEEGRKRKKGRERKYENGAKGWL